MEPFLLVRSRAVRWPERTFSCETNIGQHINHPSAGPLNGECVQNGPIEHEPLEGLDFHSDLLFLDPRRRRWRNARKAVHRRRQCERFGGQITRKVYQCLERVLEAMCRACGYRIGDRALQLGKCRQERRRWQCRRIWDAIRPSR